MGDILPGTTFTPGQLITPDILNRLVGDAEIVDKSIKATMLADDFISALGEIADSEGEDYLIIWDASENALKKIKKTDLAGTAPNVSTADGTLSLGGSSGNTALDFTGSTASNIIKSDNFTIQQSGAMFLPSDVVNLYGSDLAFDYNSTTKTLKYFPLGNTSDPQYAFFGKQLSSIGHKEGQSGLLALSGRDDDVNGVAQYNNWYIYSMADRPQLNIYPDNNMTERPSASENLSEPRVNIRGHVYISDFDDPLKALPIVADNTKPKLFVDDIYNTDGTALVKDGALVSSSTSSAITDLTNRITALENAGTPSGVINHLGFEVGISTDQNVTSGSNQTFSIASIGIPTSATSLYVSLQHNGNSTPGCTFEYWPASGFNQFNKHAMVLNSSDKSQTLGQHFWIPVDNGKIYYKVTANNTWALQAHAYM